MRLSLVHDQRFQNHINPPSHPESVKRLSVFEEHFLKSSLPGVIDELVPIEASEDDIAMVHSAAYVEALKERADLAEHSNKLVAIDGDTYLSPKTYATAKLAAGAGLTALNNMSQSLENSSIDSSFVAVRPPGHHALAAKGMGFCLFNNVAVTVRNAQKKGFNRVFVLDWDVHHGNGTEAIFYNDPSVFFLSLHQFPFWPPGSGWYEDDGNKDGKGFNLNIPLPSGTGDRGYKHAFEQIVQPVCEEFNPDLILISAGYDAHIFDPLGQQQISTAGFADMTKSMTRLRDKLQCKIICFLEGGYNTQALAESVISTMNVLEKHATDYDTMKRTKDEDPNQVDVRIDDVKKHFSQYWSSLK